MFDCIHEHLAESGCDFFALSRLQVVGQLSNELSEPGGGRKPATPRFVASGVPQSGVPAGGNSTLTIQSVPGGDVASPSQTGILLMYRDGKEKQEADAIKVER